MPTNSSIRWNGWNILKDTKYESLRQTEKTSQIALHLFFKLKSELKISPQTKILGPENFTNELYQAFMEEIILILHKLFEEAKEEQVFLNPL